MKKASAMARGDREEQNGECALPTLNLLSNFLFGTAFPAGVETPLHQFSKRPRYRGSASFSPVGTNSI
jgi:hypothetical protein